MSLAPHPFSLRQLQYAVAVADTLSFRRAAERCAVSQPSLSAQLQLLEEALGVRLFERDRRRVLLTDAGRELVARARSLVVDADELLDAGRRAADPFSGSLRIGVIPTVSPYLLPRVAPTLRRKFPRLKLLWTEEKTAEVLRLVREGGLDAAIIAQRQGLGELEVRELGEDPFVLATSKDHPLGTRVGGASAAELRDVDVLLLDEGHCFREQALAICSRARAHELEFRATSLPTLAQMVAAGAGVTLLPSMAVKTEAARARLSIRPFLEPAPRRTLTLVFRSGAARGRALEEIARGVREGFA